MEVPTLDWARFAAGGGPDGAPAFLAGLKAASEGVGFLVLDNAVDAGLAAAALAAARGFFALPLAEKRRIAMGRSPHFRGYVELGAETTAGAADLREKVRPSQCAPLLAGSCVPGGVRLAADRPPPCVAGLQVEFGTEQPPLAAEPGGGRLWERLRGPNQWPADGAVPGFRPALSALFAAMDELSQGLVRALALCLRLPPSAFRPLFYGAGGGDGPHMQASINRYPAAAVAADGGDGVLGVGPHSDSGFLTLVLQEPGQDGLEALPLPGGGAGGGGGNAQWLDVKVLIPPPPPSPHTRARSVGPSLRAPCPCPCPCPLDPAARGGRSEPRRDAAAADRRQEPAAAGHRAPRRPARPRRRRPRRRRRRRRGPGFDHVLPQPSAGRDGFAGRARPCHPGCSPLRRRGLHCRAAGGGDGKPAGRQRVKRPAISDESCFSFSHVRKAVTAEVVLVDS